MSAAGPPQGAKAPLGGSDPRSGAGTKGQRGTLGLALQWWLSQLESPTTRRALLERHSGPPA